MTFEELALRKLLRNLGSVVVGYSGGIDSALLAYLAEQELGTDAVSVLLKSALVPKCQEDDAVQIAEMLKLNLKVVQVEPLASEKVASNPKDRCYHCKKLLFGEICKIASKKGIPYILDGANADDINDYRPGARAAKELGVRSPFQELGIMKKQIRAIARDLGIPIWDKPSYACLASRIPYGTRLDADKLRRIGDAEKTLTDMGFGQCRVREHGNLVRIELAVEEIERITEKDVREKVLSGMQKLGYQYVSLDLAGYRTGSMNELL